MCFQKRVSARGTFPVLKLPECGGDPCRRSPLWGRQTYTPQHVALIQQDRSFLWVPNDRQLNSRADTILKGRGLPEDVSGDSDPGPAREHGGRSDAVRRRLRAAQNVDTPAGVWAKLSVV